MFRKVNVVFSLVVGLTLVLAACAPARAPVPEPTKAPPTAAPTQAPQPTAAPTEDIVSPEETMEQGILPEVDPAQLSETIYVAGSSTVYPLSEAVAENFKADGFPGEIKIDSIGSGAGFERFCKTGETDISNASRAIKDGEVENCKAINRNPIEFRVGTDAIAIVVSNKNDFLADVTLEELGMIFSDKTVKWSDVRAEWPNKDILRFTPGTDSGTFDFFVEEVIQKPNKIEKLEDAKKVVLAAKNLQTSEDDNVLVQGVEGSPYAIGYFGFAYYVNEAQNLKAISLNGVAPSAESAESGEYKLARPLFIYSDASIMKEKAQVAGFINYYLTYVNDLIEGVGYFPASEESLKASRQAWLEAMK